MKCDINWSEFNPASVSCIIYNNNKYSYTEISHKINEIKNAIIDIASNDSLLIGLILKRSPLQILCPLAVLKCGHTYVPLNARWPRKRIKYVLDQSGINLVIMEKEIFEEIKTDLKYEKIKAINDSLILIFIKKESNLIKNVKGGNFIAYIIYTSGTTGNPKGVAVGINALINLKNSLQNTLELESGKKILSLADYSFDMFVPEGLLALSWGLTVVMADNLDIINPRRLNKMLIKYKPEYIQIVPSALKLIMLVDPTLTSLKSVDKLMIGAETLSVGLVNDVKKYYCGKIYNLYGPTEATVWCTIADLSQEKDVHIGKALNGCNIILVNFDGKTAVAEESGEIYITGVQLAEKYWNNPIETMEKFIVLENKRYYKSGDVGYYDKNGNLHCTGRIDDQIKIHGYRIELSEIEYFISSYPSVKECIVAVVQNNTDNFLVSFLVVDKDFSNENFYTYINKELPYYAIPSRFLTVDRIEYNYNGKADKNKMIELYCKGRQYEL